MNPRMPDRAVARLLDANFNRAGEGLRVMEDHARFILNDAAQSARIKSLRHELAACRKCWPAEELLAARNVRGDLARTNSTKSEQHRADAEAVARAAARRAAEAVRALEEYAKIEGEPPEAAARLGAIRYAIYECEAAILVGTNRRQRLHNARLHVLITERHCHGEWRAAAQAALQGGANVLQLREKTLSDGELLRRGTTLRGLTREFDALLLINDRPDVAMACDADGVHVGQDDLPVHAARQIVGSDRIVGVSTHSLAQAQEALATLPDYVAVGPMFSSRTKPQTHTPGPLLLQEVAALVNDAAPVVAIGGIHAGNVGELVAVRGRCVAVCEAVVGATDPAQAARDLIAAMDVQSGAK